jgi:hypothetical protein
MVKIVVKANISPNRLAPGIMITLEKFWAVCRSTANNRVFLLFVDAGDGQVDGVHDLVDAPGEAEVVFGADTGRGG